MNEKIHFAVMAVEASAKKMGINPSEMYRRLDRTHLMDRLVFGCYDVMHTQSLAHVAEDLVEALNNWEARAQ